MSAAFDAVRRPAALIVAGLIVLVQAAALVGLAVAWASDLLRGRTDVPAATAFLVLFALGIAAVLIYGARALWRGRRWARAPIITWQILLVVMALGWLGAEVTAWAVALLVSAIAVVVTLLLPAVVAATSDRGDEAGGEEHAARPR